MSKVYANGRSVIHKGDGLVNTCAVPDVCKTPSHGGPVPIPYVNVAQDGDLAQGSTSVHIEGNPVALKDSNLSTSSGDEPGTAGGGLVSSKTKGKMTWASASIDVKIEGKGVVRFMEPTQHNGNTFNTALLQQGQPLVIYGNDPLDGPNCPHCEQPKDDHKLEISALTNSYITDLIAMLNFLRQNTKVQGIRRKGGAGYMLGVLICKGYNDQGGGFIYVATSGKVTVNGLKAAVDALRGTKPDAVTKKEMAEIQKAFRFDSRWKECPASVVDLSQAIDCKRTPFGGQRVADRLTALQEIDNTVPELVVTVENENGEKTSGPLGRPDPGICAAQKVIQTALREGHYPLYMTEAYYDPPLDSRELEVLKMKPRSQEPAVRTLVHIPLATGGFQRELRSFGTGDITPSCVTCQVLLTPMLCGNATTHCS